MVEVDPFVNAVVFVELEVVVEVHVLVVVFVELDELDDVFVEDV